MNKLTSEQESLHNKLWESYKKDRLKTMGNSQYWDEREAKKCFIGGIEALRHALEQVGEGEDENYSKHFLEWRNKYWTKQKKTLLWKSKSKHLTEDELCKFYEQAFHYSPLYNNPT